MVFIADAQIICLKYLKMKDEQTIWKIDYDKQCSGNELNS